MCTELLITNLETTGADPTFLEPPGSQSGLQGLGASLDLQLGTLVIPVPILLLLPSFHTGAPKSPRISWK